MKPRVDLDVHGANAPGQALACTATCPGCQKLHSEGRVKKKEIQATGTFAAVRAETHHFSEAEECGGLGVIVHALANQQHLLDARWYFEAADYVWKVLLAAGEVPKALEAELEAKELRDEKCARLCEVVDLVGAAVGLRAYHRAMGQQGPALPPMPEKEGLSQVKKALHESRGCPKKDFF